VLNDATLNELEFELDGLEDARLEYIDAPAFYGDAPPDINAPPAATDEMGLAASPGRKALVELELTGLVAEAQVRDVAPMTVASMPDIDALRAAERERYEARLAAQMAELRLVSRRKVKEVLNRCRAEMRERVLARITELRLERQQLLARARAQAAEAVALAELRSVLVAERSAIDKERAALEAERIALGLERAALDKKRLTRKRLATKRGAARPLASARRATASIEEEPTEA